MKKQAIFLFITAAVVFASCKNDGSSEAASTTETPAATTPEAAQVIDSTAAGIYTVDLANSVIEWKGTKPTGGEHTGTVTLKSGELEIHRGHIAGGNMVMDMNSIAAAGMEPDKKGKLEGHLKSPDFFDTAKFPEGSFKFGSTMPEPDTAKYKNVAAGELTLKGIPKSILIPFNYTFKDGKIYVETPEFSVIRTEWGIQYKSGIIGTVKDELISDFINLKVKLVAVPPGAQ